MRQRVDPLIRTCQEDVDTTERDEWGAPTRLYHAGVQRHLDASAIATDCAVDEEQQRGTDDRDDQRHHQATVAIAVE